MSLNRLRTEFVTEGFLLQMRKEWAKRHPEVPCPVLTLGEYSDEDKSVLMRAVSAAMILAGPDRDIAFESWLERRKNPADTQSL